MASPTIHWQPLLQAYHQLPQQQRLLHRGTNLQSLPYSRTMARNIVDGHGMAHDPARDPVPQVLHIVRGHQL